jgi:hypothetical protein
LSRDFTRITVITGHSHICATAETQQQDLVAGNTAPL